VRVSQDGDVSFPLAGTIKVGGLGVIEAENALAAKLGQYLVSPQVSFFIKEYGNKQIYVLGEVKKPGTYKIPVGSELTVLGAVSMAEGFTMIAAPDRTRVIRNVDGKNETITVEISAITQGGQKDKDISLLPNDIVYVPQSYF
jgi:polysaccharide export outer membrane protein